MRPINLDGKDWGTEPAGLAFGDVRKEAIADLCARSERVSGGRMNADNNYAPYEAVEKPDSNRGKEQVSAGARYVINPVLVELRHTGDDELNLTKARWAEFCSEPREEAPFLERLTTERRAAKIAEMATAGAAVIDSLKDAAEPMPQVAVNDPPPKRGPGRPPNKAKVTAGLIG